MWILALALIITMTVLGATLVAFMYSLEQTIKNNIETFAIGPARGTLATGAGVIIMLRIAKGTVVVDQQVILDEATRVVGNASSLNSAVVELLLLNNSGIPVVDAHVSEARGGN